MGMQCVRTGREDRVHVTCSACSDISTKIRETLDNSKICLTTPLACVPVTCPAVDIHSRMATSCTAQCAMWRGSAVLIHILCNASVTIGPASLSLHTCGYAVRLSNAQETSGLKTGPFNTQHVLSQDASPRECMRLQYSNLQTFQAHLKI